MDYYHYDYDRKYYIATSFISNLILHRYIISIKGRRSKMNTKKILVGILVVMFVFSMIPNLISEADEITSFKERKYKEFKR